jgi:hypothetical protein
MVYIEWDKKHWTYNGEPDEWTFAEHFEPVKEAQVSTPQFSPEEFGEFMANAFSQFLGQKEQQDFDLESEEDTGADELTMLDLDEGDQEEAHEMLAKMLADAKRAQADPLGALLDDDRYPSREEYHETLSEAAAASADDEGFVLITIVKGEDGRIRPTYTAAFTTPESAMLAEASVASIAALGHGDLVQTVIALLANERKRRDDSQPSSD